MDTFVVSEGVGLQPGMAKIPMIRIDDVVSAAIPRVVKKIYVEGFQMEALKGATQLLSNRNLQAIAVEISALAGTRSDS
jgi:hypothetical protein